MRLWRWSRHHRARNAHPQTSRSQRSDSGTKAAMLVSVVAAIASIASAWLSYHQTQLQADQTRVAVDQLRLQALQAVPFLVVQRGQTDAKTGRPSIDVCGSQEAFSNLSGMRVRWMPEVGRYGRPATLLNTSSVDVAVVLPDEPVWGSSIRLGGEQCATVVEPSWSSFQMFVQSNMSAPHGYSYWYRSFAFVTLFLRDHAGQEHLRHYAFTHEGASVGVLVSEGEAAQLNQRYETAIALGRRLTIETPHSDLSGIHSMFR